MAGATRKQPMFLERESYRRRRLGDAARLGPFTGLVLLLLSGLWTTTAGAMIYIFVVWAILIVVIGVLSVRLMPLTEDSDEAEPSVPPER